MIYTKANGCLISCEYVLIYEATHQDRGNKKQKQGCYVIKHILDSFVAPCLLIPEEKNTSNTKAGITKKKVGARPIRPI